MKKCSFNASFASGGEEKRRDDALLSSVLSLLGARKDQPKNDEEDGMPVPTTRGEGDPYLPDMSDSDFAKSVENAKNRSSATGNLTETAHFSQDDGEKIAKNDENRKIRKGSDAENDEKRVLSQRRTESAARPDPRAAKRKGGEDYFSPPPCYRVP